MLGRFSRLSVALLPALLLALILLTPLAYESPPDPSWVSGIYDGADYDDVVILITSAVGAVSSYLLTELRPLHPPATRIAPLVPVAAFAPPSESFQPRAPPTS